MVTATAKNGRQRPATGGKGRSAILKAPVPAPNKPASGVGALRESAQKSTYQIAESALARYKVGMAIGAVATGLRDATPMQRVAAEREGVAARLVKDLASQMAIPAVRMFKIIGVPKATAERKAEKNEVIAGGGGQSALGVLSLLGIAQTIVAESTDEKAAKFDVAKWLGRWIESPQPALGGRKPADILDTPTGIEVVARLLGSLQSGAYQ